MNKTFFKSILFVGLAACMFSCKDDNSPLDGGNTPQGVNVKFDYSQAKLGKSVGSSATLNGSSDVDWTIEVEEGDFFSVEPMSGKAGDFTLTVTANKENTSTDKAYSKFIFNASGRKYPITVIHLEDDIRLEPSYDAETVFSFAQDGTLVSPDLTAKPFTATSNIEWTVKTVNEADTWIKVGPEVGEIGENLPVTVVVDENPFAKVREGKFEVRVPEAMSFQYTVTQAAAPLDYEIKDGEKVLTEQAGLTGLGGGGETRTITLNANADWKIEPGTDSEWLTFEPSESVASLEPVEVKVMVEPNDDMAQGRSGLFIVTFGDGTSEEINVQQNKGEEPNDAKILKALEFALEGDNTDVLNWSSGTNYKDWTGVKFEGGNLVELNLSGVGLKGYIPKEVSQLVSLRVLDLSNNELTASQGLQPVKYGNADEEEAYIPAIPVEIKNLTELTTFKLKGNKIEGVFPSDLVNHPHYFEWDAMTNIYPQSGEKSDISYVYGSGAKYDTSSKADPSQWKFRLTSTGILRAIYNNMGGTNWAWTQDPNANGGTKYPQPSGERPIYMDVEYKLDNKVYPTNKVPGVHQVNGNTDITGKGNVVSAFGHVTKMVGEFPLEILMNNHLGQLYVFGGGSQFTRIHPLMISRFTYFKVTGISQFTMNINDIYTNLHKSPKAIDLRNNGLTGTLNTDILPSGCNQGASDPKTWTEVLAGNQVTISGN